jgi:hypothetical protein
MISELEDEIEEITFAVSTFSSPELSVASRLLTSVAMDAAHGRTASLLLFAVDTGRVYSPYDSGADLFAENVRARDLLRDELRDWASSREDGL